MTTNDKIEIENINIPGRIERVDTVKYTAMKIALLKVLTKNIPGDTTAEIKKKLLPILPQNIFPDGEKSGWWLKAVQLDLEAKGRIKREDTKPLRFYRKK